MKSKNRKARKVAPKPSRKAKKPTLKDRAKAHPPREKVSTERRDVAPRAEKGVAPPVHVKEGVGLKIAVDAIDLDTRVGDLIVVFPRTREVLKRHGLRLEVEEAGDIYMTLETFAAMKGVKANELIEEVVQVSKEPAPQPMPPVPQLAPPPPA